VTAAHDLETPILQAPESGARRRRRRILGRNSAAQKGARPRRSGWRMPHSLSILFFKASTELERPEAPTRPDSEDGVYSRHGLGSPLDSSGFLWESDAARSDC